MTEEKDHIPEDFNVEGLLDPSDLTNADFEVACSQIDSLGEPSITENRITVFVDQFFEDGSHLTGHSVSGSEEYIEAWGETEPVRSIFLKSGDGTVYEYSAYLNGARKLFIKRQNGSIPQEVPTAGDTTQEINVGSVVVRGASEVVDPLLVDMAKAKEADRLGVSRLTDTSLAELTTSIQKALSSGAVVAETK